MGQQEIGEGDQHPLALCRCPMGPVAPRETHPRSLHGELGILGHATGHPGQRATIHRTQVFEGRVALGGLVAAVDEGSGFDGQRLGTPFPVLLRQHGHDYAS